jgi:hypothetical protein
MVPPAERACNINIADDNDDNHRTNNKFRQRIHPSYNESDSTILDRFDPQPKRLFNETTTNNNTTTTHTIITKRSGISCRIQPASPISVLGARPMVEQTKNISNQFKETSLLEPLPPLSTVLKENDRMNHHHIQSIPTAPTMQSSCSGGFSLDMNTPSNFETSVNDDASSLDSKQQQDVFEDDDDGIPNVIPRWKVRQEKRLALCRQRVHLERRLYETMMQQQWERQDSIVLLNQPMKEFTIQCETNKNQMGDCHSYQILWSGLAEGGDDSNDTALPTGFGRMINHKMGQVYEGQCQRGLRHGYGDNVWTTSGQVYTGEWVANQREGRGTHTWLDGRTVTGGWKSGQLHGRIFFTWPNGTTYDGDALHGQKHGRGTQIWNTGRTYSGQFQAGYAHGVGMLTESNQNKYRGQFQNGLRHGYGVQVWDNKLYEGEWYENNIHGRGNLLWRDSGAKYTGEFNFGLYHGIGIYKEGKTQYVGHWRDGYKEGEGKATWSDGRVYEGSFHKNKRHGYGRMVYADCSLYIGGWHHGKRCGEGIGIDPHGIVQHCGIWNNDRPIDSNHHSMVEESKVAGFDDLIMLTRQQDRHRTLTQVDLYEDSLFLRNSGESEETVSV